MEVDVPILFIQGSDQLLNVILSISNIIQCIGTGNRLNYTKYPVITKTMWLVLIFFYYGQILSFFKSCHQFLTDRKVHVQAG